MRPLTLRALILLGLGSLAIGTTACGSDGGGGNASGDFCDFVAQAEEVDMEEDPEAAAALMEEMRAKAPVEIKDDIEVLLGVVEKMADIDEDDEEAVGELFTLVLDPEVIAAGERLEEYGVEECGMDPDDFGSSDNLDDLGRDEDGDPFGDEDVTDEDTGADESGLSIDALQAHLDEDYADEPWVDQLSSWSILNGDQIEVGPFGEDLSEDDAFAACDALLEIVLELAPDAELVISDAVGEPVVMRGRGDPACTHA